MVLRGIDLPHYTPYRDNEGRVDHIRQMRSSERGVPKSLEWRRKINDVFRGIAHGVLGSADESNNRAA